MVTAVLFGALMMALRFGSKKRAAQLQDCATFFSHSSTAVVRIMSPGFYPGYRHWFHVKTIYSGKSATGLRGARSNLAPSLLSVQLSRILDQRSSLNFKLWTSTLVVHYGTGSDVVTKKKRAPPHLYGAGWEQGWEDVRISVWWDFENCHIPVGFEVHKVGYNIVSGLRTSGFKGPVSIAAYGDILQISRSAQEALTSTGIRLCHVPCGGKDSTDRALLVDLILWTVEHPPPAHLFLISGDRDFSDMLHRLRMKNYNILLACPSGGVVSPALLGAATHVWRWNSLVRGEGLQGAFSSLDPKPPDMTPPQNNGLPRSAPPDMVPPQNNGVPRSAVPPISPPASPAQEESSSSAMHSKACELDTAGKTEQNRSVRGVPKYVLQKLERLFDSHPNGILLHDLQNHLIQQGIKFQRDFYGHGQIVPFLLAIPEVVKVEGPVKDKRSWTYLLTPTQRKTSSRPDSNTSADKADGSGGQPPSPLPQADVSHENLLSADGTRIVSVEGSGTAPPAQQPESPPSSSENDMGLSPSLPMSSSSAGKSKEESGISKDIHNVKPKDSASPQVHPQSLELKPIPSAPQEEQTHPTEGLGSSPTPAELVDDVSQAHKSSFWASFIQAVQGWVRRREVSAERGQLRMRISKSDAIRAGTDAVVPEAHMTTFRPPSHSSSASKSLDGNDDTGHGCIGKVGEADEAKSKENDRQALAGRGNEGQAEELRFKEKLSEESKQNVAIPAAAEESKGHTSEKLGTDAKDGDASVSVSKPEQQDPLEVSKAYWKALLFRMGRIQTTVSSSNLPKTSECKDLHVNEEELCKQTWNELLSQSEKAIPLTEESNPLLPQSDTKRTWNDFFFGPKKSEIHSLPSVMNEPVIVTTKKSATEIEKQLVHQIERNDTNLSLDPPTDMMPSLSQQINLADFPTSSTELTSMSKVLVNETEMPQSQKKDPQSDGKMTGSSGSSSAEEKSQLQKKDSQADGKITGSSGSSSAEEQSQLQKKDSQADGKITGSSGSSSTVVAPPPLAEGLQTSPSASIVAEQGYPSFQQFQVWLGGFLERSIVHNPTVQRRGMDISDIKPAFEKEFGMKLDPRAYGFLKVKELVFAIPDIAEVVCPRHEQVFLFPVKSSAIRGTAKKSHRDLKNDCEQLLRKLLLENPQGIPASKLKPAFASHYDYVLDHRSEGYPRLSDLLRLMPDVVMITQSATGVQLLAASNQLRADYSIQIGSSFEPMTEGPKNTTSEELTDEGEESSCLQEELPPQALDDQSFSTIPSQLEAPGLAPFNPGSQSSSIWETPLISKESPLTQDQPCNRLQEPAGSCLLEETVARDEDEGSSGAQHSLVCKVETTIAVNAPDDPSPPHVKPLPEKSVLLMTVSSPSEEVDVERLSEETNVAEDFRWDSAESVMVTHPEHFAALPEAAGEAMDEKPVEIEDSLTQPETLTSGAVQLHGACPDTTGGVIAEKEETSIWNSSSNVSEIEADTPSSLQATESSDRSSFLEEEHCSTGEVANAVDGDNGISGSSQPLCGGDAHGSFTTHAGDNSFVNIDNRKNDVSGKDACYNSSEEHMPPAKSLAMTREVSNTSESNFEFSGSGSLEKVDTDVMAPASTSGQEDQAQEEDQASDVCSAPPIAAPKPVRKSLWQRLFE